MGFIISFVVSGRTFRSQAKKAKEEWKAIKAI